MASRSFNLRRAALTVALGVSLAGVAHAQSSVGSIFGSGKAGDSVTVSNAETGFSRQVAVGSDGKYSFSQLAPGHYTVKSGTDERTVDVKIGTGTPVNFAVTAKAAGNELGTITVTGAGVNPIDVSSVESTTVLTRDQIQKLPVSRDVTSVALLAPGTTRGSGGLFSGLASFGGASVAENGYYINGFDVTNMRKLTSYAALPFEAIGEQQIKTGGYGAEYGRSLGGVVSLSTRRGTNTWHGGASVYWLPRGLQSHGRDSYSKDPLNLGDPYSFNSADRNDSLRYNVFASGPLVKDRLFFFGLVQGQKVTDDTFTKDDSTRASNKSPTGMVKLDWNINSRNLLEFTGIYNKEKSVRSHYTSTTPYSSDHQQYNYTYDVPSGGDVLIAKYTGYLTDRFTLSAQFGQLRYNNAYVKGGLPGESCPTVYDGRTNPALDYMGCWPEATFAAVRPSDARADRDTRRAWRLDAEWQLGSHVLRGGLDSERFVSTFTPATYAGGVYYRYYKAPGSGTTNGVANTQPYVRVRHLIATGGSYLVKNQAAYLEDTWHVSDNFLIYLGARVERFDNKNAVGESFIKSKNLFAPRLGFSWDVYGDSSFKVFGNAGRYFIPVASNTSIREAAGEDTVTEYYQFSAIDPATGKPTLGAKLGATAHSGSPVPPNSATVAATNLKPMYQDEMILGFQKQLSANWNVGMRAIRRKVQSGFDDTCDRNPLNQWATDHGYTNYDFTTSSGCYIINPGRDVNIALDLQNNGQLQTVTIPASYFNLPKYRRNYSALEFFFEGFQKDKWSLQGSYTFSKTVGNVEGYVNTTLQQDDSGIVQDFDAKQFEDGAYGYLPNDRRHTVKLFGTYNLTPDWRLGANFLVQSGRPVNCNGYIPDAAPQNQGVDWYRLGTSWGASSFYCVDANGQSHLTNRGDHGRTPWTQTLDLSLAWTPQFAKKRLTLQVDAFNVLNNRQITSFNETNDRNRAAPEQDPNYLNATGFQSPRAFRVSARYEF